MRIELLVLSLIASAALGALVDSARRAARTDPDDDAPGGPVPMLRAALEDLERTRSRVDDAGPRLLVTLAALAGLAAVACESLGICAELSAVLIAVGIGLALPGISWARDQAQRARTLDLRISHLRERLAARDHAAKRRAASAVVTNS